MLPHFLTSLFAAIGVGGFVYSKTAKYTGGDNKSSLFVGGLAALITFALVLYLANTFLN